MSKDKKQKEQSKKSESKSLITTFTVNDVEKLLKEDIAADYDSRRILPKISDFLTAMANRKVKPKDEDNKLLLKAAMIYGLDNHIPLVEIVEERYRGLVVEFCKNLIQEYDCKTPSEKALAEVVVNAYIRILACSRRVNNSLTAEWLSHERNQFLSIVGKELDRANRQFVSGIQTLKQLKASPMEVKVTAQTAFVSQQQHIQAITGDVTKTVNKENNENIKSI